MHVLIPYDIATTGMKNPYLYLLLRELEKHNQVTKVTYGYGWLNEGLQPDIVHLHWPELLVKSSLTDMSRVDLLTADHFSDKLKSLKSLKKRGAKIVVTIHNERPHKENDERFGDFYKDVYQLADGFIHMGKSSEKLTMQQFRDQTVDKQSSIIPHGNYDYFPSDMDRDQCRELLSLEHHQKLILVFGAIRSEKELNLGLYAFRRAGLEDAVYLMAGKLPFPHKSQWQHFKARKELYKNCFNKRIRVVESVISPQDVQIYLKSADLVLIPRYNTLNSGNVALGFTFGKVVSGPGYGVIGEVLNKTGNPVFDPANIDNVAKSIKDGLKLAAEGLGEKNREYASEKMSWDKVADLTVQSYRSLHLTR